MTGFGARAVVEAELRLELFGPSGEEDPNGNPIDRSSGSLRFETAEASRGQFFDAITLEEILTNGVRFDATDVSSLWRRVETRAP